MELTNQELRDLYSALEHAIEDAEHYLKHGTPETDFEGNEGDLARYREMPDRWLSLRQKILAEQDHETKDGNAA